MRPAPPAVKIHLALSIQISLKMPNKACLTQQVMVKTRDGIKSGSLLSDY